MLDLCSLIPFLARRYPHNSCWLSHSACRKRSRSFTAAEDGPEATRKQAGAAYRIKGLTSQLIRNPDREWTVHGPIRGTDVNGCYYVDPGIQDEYKHCLKALQRRQFVLLAGARASGKTTRLFWLKRELEAKGYQVI
jgi:hypothetical protein